MKIASWRFGIALVLLAAISSGSLSASPEAEQILRTELEIERSLLLADLEEYTEARRREVQARERALDLSSRIDGILDQERISAEDLAQLSRLEGSLLAAQGMAESASLQAHDARIRLRERWRRILRYEEAAGSLGQDLEQGRDPLSGRWSVQVLPSGQEGLFVLRLDGTLVQGAYLLDGGYSGSLRGTYVARRLRLERVDSEQGFDLVYEGRVQESAGEIQGTWKATLLNAAGPAGGTWTASRVRSESAEDQY
jgi:hypothetical protein